MYFPFFILHDRGKKSAEAAVHCAVLPYIEYTIDGDFLQNNYQLVIDKYRNSIYGPNIIQAVLGLV